MGRNKVDSLPDDLKKLADQLINKKFDKKPKYQKSVDEGLGYSWTHQEYIDYSQLENGSVTLQQWAGGFTTRNPFNDEYVVRMGHPSINEIYSVRSIMHSKMIRDFEIVAPKTWWNYLFKDMAGVEGVILRENRDTRMSHDFELLGMKCYIRNEEPHAKGRR